MQENNRLIVIDDKNQEIEMEILFTFEDETRKKKYVLYINPNVDEPEVFASSYDEDGNLFPIESEEEWAMVEEVFGTYNEDFEVEEA